MYTIYVCTNDRVVCLPGENLPSLAEEASLLDPTSRTFEDGGEREAREKEREKECVFPVTRNNRLLLLLAIAQGYSRGHSCSTRDHLKE